MTQIKLNQFKLSLRLSFLKEQLKIGFSASIQVGGNSIKRRNLIVFFVLLSNQCNLKNLTTIFEIIFINFIVE